MKVSSFFINKNNVLLTVFFLLTVPVYPQNLNEGKSSDNHIETQYQLKWLIKESTFYKDLTGPLLDSLFVKGSITINNFMPVLYSESNRFKATITLSGEGDDSNYEFVMVDEDRGILLMHLWRTGLGMNEEGEEFETKESSELKVFEVFEGDLVERTEEYFNTETFKKTFTVQLTPEQPKQIVLNGKILNWDGKVFRSDVRQAYLSGYFRGLLADGQVSELIKNGQVEHKRGGLVTYSGNQSLVKLKIEMDPKVINITQAYSPDGSVASYSEVLDAGKKKDQKLSLAVLENDKFKEVTRELINSVLDLSEIKRQPEMEIDTNGLIWIEGRTYRFEQGKLNNGLTFESDQGVDVRYFDEPYHVADVNELIGAFEQKDQLTEEIVELLYPPRYRFNLFDRYTGSFWDGNSETLNIKDIQVHDTYASRGYRFFHYSFPIWETEGVKGRKHIVRVMKNGNMLMEFEGSEGEGFGAMASSHEVAISLVPGGFVRVKKDFTNFPQTMMWNDAVNLDIQTNQGSVTEEYIGIVDDKAISHYQMSSKLVEFANATSIEEKLKKGITPERIISEGVLRKEDVGRSELMQLASFILKMKKDIDDELNYLTDIFDHETIVKTLNLKSFDNKVTHDNIAIYQVTTASDKQAVILFNTLNLVSNAGDAEDDIYQQLLNIDGKAPHFSLLSGYIQDIKDITGDGLPEIIVNSVSNYRNDFQGSIDIYQINEYHELVEIDIPRLTVNFIGGECKEINGYASKISFSGNRLKVEMESGGNDCNNQQFEKRTVYYNWSATEKRFIRE